MKSNPSAKSAVGDPLAAQAIDRVLEAEREAQAAVMRCERAGSTVLEAARQQLSQDGKEGVSVAQVAQRAGVNRGTAYQHFQTREQLIEATAAWVSDKLYRSVFGDPVFTWPETFVTSRL